MTQGPQALTVKPATALPEIVYIQARNHGGGICPPKISKHCIAILTFAETFKEQKMKFYILIIFEKSYLNFLCLAC